MRQQGEVFTHPDVQTRLTAEDEEAEHDIVAFQVRVIGEGLAAVALGLREVAAAIRFHADSDRTPGPRTPR